MGRGPVLRADFTTDRPMVATFGQLEPDEADFGKRCFGYSRLGWGLGFMGH